MFTDIDTKVKENKTCATCNDYIITGSTCCGCKTQCVSFKEWKPIINKKRKFGGKIR